MISGPWMGREEPASGTGPVWETKWVAEPVTGPPARRPPSPFSPASPLPTRVEIRPVAGASRRIWWFDESAIRTWPAALIDNPSGLHRSAGVADLPFPLKPQFSLPAPRLVHPPGAPRAPPP